MGQLPGLWRLTHDHLLDGDAVDTYSANPFLPQNARKARFTRLDSTIP